MSIRINVNPSNPGQFFACCGLLELADRLWLGAEGFFEGCEFRIETCGSQGDLINALLRVKIVQLDPDDDTSSPIELAAPFRTLRLDWWQDDRAGGKELKIWAGTMESVRIAQAMQYAMRNVVGFLTPDLFDVGLIARDPDKPEKKVEPYYFDARRGPNAHSRDVGFAPNDLHITTTAFPAVELLCLIGLQRCLPLKIKHRIFDYYTWTKPLPTSVLPAAISGLLAHQGSVGYRFENWYRTGQKKHKAFLSATPHSMRGQP